MSRAAMNRRRPLTGAAVSPVTPAPADAMLVAWCREIEEIEDGSWPTDEECGAALEHQSALIRRLTDAPATTVVGLVAKLKVLRTMAPICDDTEFKQSAMKVFMSALADAERLASEAGNQR